MSGLTIDVTAANRFISSLSKSLQALCHGCMEFSSGIEIMGYININIDQGNKVDYVLNEKVLKSTTNSMTFVSNSFLAKKDQPKHTRDGACSPVLEFELQQQSPHKGSNQHSMHQYYRSSHAHSSQLHQFRSYQKRTWSGREKDWKVSHKKRSLRDVDSFEQCSSIDNSITQVPRAVDSFLTPELPVLNYNSSDFNIKKESVDISDSLAKENESEYSQSESFSNDHNAEGKVRIKPDPDDFSETQGTTKRNHQPSSNSNVASFFDKVLESQNPDSDEQGHCSSHKDVESSMTDNAELPDNLDTSNAKTSNPEASMNSEMPFDFVEAQDTMSYPQSSITDQDEGFDIIEINDEDEADIYGDAGTRMDGAYSTYGYEQQMSAMTYINPDHNPPFTCDFCQVQLPSLNRYRQHIAINHSHALPYSCTICGKGFLNMTTLKRHTKDHRARQFQCSLCHLKFKRNYHLKRHMKNLHDQATCSGCFQTFKQGTEYSNHLSQCDAIKRQLNINSITQ